MPRGRSREVEGDSQRTGMGGRILDPAGIVHFRAKFDGSPKAWLRGKTAAPVEASPLAYVQGTGSKALKVDEGTRLRYDLGGGFPHEAGSLEFRFRPEFPQDSEQVERTVLRLWGKGGRRITLSYQPVGNGWDFLVEGPGKKHSLRAWYGAAKQGRWSHFLLSWNRKARPCGELAFYHDGVLRYGGMRVALDFDLRGLASMEVGGDGPGQVSLDEIAIYRRPLNQPQARYLSTRFREPEGRFASLAQRVEADERHEQAVAERRRAFLRKLDGKVGGLLQLRGQKPQTLAFPEGIRATAVRPEDVLTTDLTRFSVIHFPPGGGYQLTEEEKARIVKYVKGGGGYVGVCQGAYTAHKLGLLDFQCHTFYEVGLTPLELEKHPVTAGCPRRIQMHHGNGPIMVPGRGCDAVGSYRIEGIQGKPGAILVGTHGKGRVVLFGPHPQGGGVSVAGKRVGFTGEDLETDRLLVNALLYAAGLTGAARGGKRRGK